MTEKLDKDALMALKIAFSYMPKTIEVTKYEYGDCDQTILRHRKAVREVLLINDVDPDEVSAEIDPDKTPNSIY